MKVILIKDVENKGKTNDIIDVSDGYAKNYLIKKGFAITKTPYNLKRLNFILTKQKEKNEKIKFSLEKLKTKLEKITLVFKLNVYNNKIFGSISLIQIEKQLMKKFNLKIDKKKFINNSNLTDFGLHYLKIKLSSNIIGVLKIIIEKRIIN